ncbi:hypothetical protein EV138_7404 [Kribbella voronezhensis]|uniref:Uncharacterized protein n=1 Tax=Kribbella voronezhensis TaxID=2512212 RepID=A0A4R7STB4_9ACTN|nr:hypothetical protein [Kribbella voronezhensis]TDU82510.1 hypothetical protein EV138_7404 [Kribbella voronezhensis]
MPLDIAEFNDAFYRARDRVRAEEGIDVAAVQAELRSLIPNDASDHDRAWTTVLIDGLAEPPEPPREWSEFYHQASEVHAAAYRADGSVEEQIAALERARETIWDIADRAAKDEAPHIRAMTRVLEHLEDELRDPTWPHGDSAPPTT